MKATRLHIDVLWGALGICTVATMLANGAQVPSQNAKDTPEIRTLLSQRVAVLQELADSMPTTYKLDAATVDALSAADSELLMGKLDMAESTRERIEIHEELVKVAQRREEAVKRMEDEGSKPRAEALRARASLLQAQVTLAREQLAGN